MRHKKQINRHRHIYTTTKEKSLHFNQLNPI